MVQPVKKRKATVYRDSSDDGDNNVAHSRMLFFSLDGRRCLPRFPSTFKISHTALNTYSDDDKGANLHSQCDVDQFAEGDIQAYGCAKDVTKHAAKRYQTSDAPLLEWLGQEGKKGYRDEYLLEELLLESRGSWGDLPCTCSPGGRNERLYRCNDCLGMEVVCRACCVNAHQRLPLHNVKMWNGSSFQRVYLKDLGLCVELGHKDCVNRERGHVNFLVMDVGGIHPVDVSFCGCDKRVSHRQQLIRTGWFPATVHNPRTACTKQALSHFLRLTWSSKISAFEYYRALELLTDSTKINVPATRYPAFLRMIRQTRHLKLMKHGGRGNTQGGVDQTGPGELAVICPACPHPGINLPDDWKDAEPSRKFLYCLILAMDANFRLKNRNRSSHAADPGLHTGLAYFVPEEAYQAHLSKFITQKDLSTCSGFKSMAHADSKYTTGLRSTGVGLSICARHEFVRPTGVGDLQHGERYCNMDYIFFSSLVPLLLLSVVVSYDIACQWKINLFKRMGDLPARLQLPLTVATTCFMFGVPKFHAPAHAANCAIPHSLNLMPGVGRTDGEGVERAWADLNRVANSTKEMGPGARHDTIDCQIGHHNWDKFIGIGELLRRRLLTALSESRHQQDALEEFNRSIDTEHREAWTCMARAWESDKTRLNPYLAVKKYASEADVRAELAKVDEEAAASGRPGHHEMSPGSFVSLGLVLQETQRRLKSDIKIKPVTYSPELKKRRATLRRQIEHFRTIQPVYMAGAAALAAKLPEPSKTEPEDVPLILPSSLDSANRKQMCISGIDAIEEKLRESQCRDALAKLRTYLHTRTHFIKYKNTNVRGQRPNTRARGLINNLSNKINLIAEKYRLARLALLALRGHGPWEDELRLLRSQDIVAADASAIGDIDEAPDAKETNKQIPCPRQPERSKKTTGEGRRTTSWIWKTMGTLGENDSLNEALRIEWLKSRARAARWSEEVLLLREEMRRVLVFTEWKVKWWKERCCVVGKSKHYMEGIRAYANRQAALYQNLRAHFITLWKNLAMNGGKGLEGGSSEAAVMTGSGWHEGETDYEADEDDDEDEEQEEM